MADPTTEPTAAERIWHAVAAIPRGYVASYGQVALRAGLPRAARLVGRVLSRLPNGTTLPWHRVVNARGCITLRRDSPAYHTQIERLRAEGIPVHDGRVDRRYFDESTVDIKPH